MSRYDEVRLIDYSAELDSPPPHDPFRRLRDLTVPDTAATERLRANESLQGDFATSSRLRAEKRAKRLALAHLKAKLSGAKLIVRHGLAACESSVADSPTPPPRPLKRRCVLVLE